MKARFATPDDDRDIDRLIDNNVGHDVRLGLDEICVTGEPARGLLVYRPSFYIHELICGRDMVSRARATALVDFAMRRGLELGVHSAIFLVKADNLRMASFVEGLGCVKQSDPGDLVYTWRRGLNLTREQWIDAAENPEFEEED